MCCSLPLSEVVPAAATARHEIYFSGDFLDLLENQASNRAINFHLLLPLVVTRGAVPEIYAPHLHAEIDTALSYVERGAKAA